MIPKPLNRAGTREGLASILGLTGMAGAAEKGAARGEDAGAQGHLTHPPTHPFPRLQRGGGGSFSLFLSATFS